MANLRLKKENGKFYLYSAGHLSPFFCFNPNKQSDITLVAALLEGLLDAKEKEQPKGIVRKLKGLVGGLKCHF